MLSIQDEVLPISILTGQEREAARDAGVEVQGGRRAKDGDRADGDEADAVLLREPGRRLLQEHLGHAVPPRRRLLGSEVLDVGPGALVQDVPVALQLRPNEDRRYRRGQHHAPHRAGDGVVEAAFHVKVGAEDRQGAERRRRLRGPGPPAWSVEGDGYAPAMVSGGAGCVERAAGGVEVAGSRPGGRGAGGRAAATRAEGRWRPGARADGRRRCGRTAGSGAS